MARDNLAVDKLLKLKPTRAELFYPTLPTYEEAFEGETEDGERQREQRNEKRKVDWENECEQIEYRGPMIDRIPWDEADPKVKSLIYLSLGTEGCRTYHQRNPHTRIERCTTNELVHELSLRFTRPRNLTFDRFQFFRAIQSNESLETFYSRTRVPCKELGPENSEKSGPIPRTRVPCKIRTTRRSSKRSVHFEHAWFQYTNGTTFGSQNTTTGAQLCHQ